MIGKQIFILLGEFLGWRYKVAGLLEDFAYNMERYGFKLNVAIIVVVYSETLPSQHPEVYLTVLQRIVNIEQL